MKYLSVVLGVLPLIGLIVLCVLKRMGKLTETGPYDPEFADPPDDVMAVADAVGFQRAEPWTGDNVIAQFDRRPAPGRRLSDGWIAYAEAEYDWHAAEYMATGKRTEVTH